MSDHPFAARPKLPKRHTSPSPSALLSLPTLEELPPTPRSAKAYGRSPVTKANANLAILSQHPLPGSITPKSNFDLTFYPDPDHNPNPSTNMPLIKTRSSKSRRFATPQTQTQGQSENQNKQYQEKTQNQKRSGHSSFLPFGVPSIVNAFDLRGKHQRQASQSQPPLSPPLTSAYEFGAVQSFSPFSSSTPPATFSQGSFSAMPSIQGVIDTYAGRDDVLKRSPSASRKGKGKKEKRETMNLPTMLLSSATSPYRGEPSHNTQAYDGSVFADEITRMDPDLRIDRARNLSPSASTSGSATLPLSRIQQPRYRKTSLTIETTHRTPLSDNSPPDTDNRDELYNWLGGSEDEDLDDVASKALDVLEYMNGHLMRDGYGYCTGPSPIPVNGLSTTRNAESRKRVSPYDEHGALGDFGLSRSSASLSVSAMSTGSRDKDCKRSESSTRVNEAHQREDLRHSQQAGDLGGTRPSDQRLFRSWIDTRKRTKSYGFNLNLMDGSKRSSKNDNHDHGRDDHHHHHQPRGRGSLSISSHRPPPPPPGMSLPPWPTTPSTTSINSRSHSRANTNTNTYTNNVKNTTENTRIDVNKDKGKDSWDMITSNCINKVSPYGNSFNFNINDNANDINREASSSYENNRASLPTNSFSHHGAPPPVPPRSASRAGGEGDKSLRRRVSKKGISHLPHLPTMGTVAVSAKAKGGKKSLEDTRGVSVPLVLATTSQEDVVIIEKRPQSSVEELPSPVEPIQQRPLPPLPYETTTLNRSGSIPHPKITARILRPKRPTTAPSLGRARGSTPTPLTAATPMSSLDSAHSRATPTKLIPRTEPRRQSADGNARGANRHSKKDGLSALSFLALDEAAARSGVSVSQYRQSQSQHRSTSFSSLSTTAHAHSRAQSQSFSHHQSQPSRAESPDGLEGGYIMPPSERSKIGVNDREERRRRRGSRSSISSVAGSVIHLDENHGYEAINVKVVGLHDNDGELIQWSSASEFNVAKEISRQHELRLSLQPSYRSRADEDDIGPALSQSLSPPPRPKPRSKNRPAPLDVVAHFRQSEADREPKAAPKSAGLLPPPRPRRKTVPSASNTIPPISSTPSSPRGREELSPTSTYRRISPRYTHRSDLDPTTPRAHDGLSDFMDLLSPLPSLSAATANSPGLETPDTLVYPASSSEPPKDMGPVERAKEEKKTDDSKITASGSGSAARNARSPFDPKLSSTPLSNTPRIAHRDESEKGQIGEKEMSSSRSTWSLESEDQREKERRIFTSVWLSSKPTNANEYISRTLDGAASTGSANAGMGMSMGMGLNSREGHSHPPFYGLGGGGGVYGHGSGAGFGSEKGKRGGVVVDGGYGRRGSPSMKV